MIQPTRHSPLLAYLLLWPTAGFYWIYWLYRMMRDLNTLHSARMFDIKRIAFIAGVYYALYAAVFALAMSLLLERSPFARPLGLIAFLIAFGWLVGLVWLHARIGQAILALQIQKGISRQASPRLAAFLFFVYFVTVPYLQSHMNSIVDEGPP